MRFFYKIVIGLIIALGSLHSVLTFVFYKDFSSRALWFFGTGLALVMLGFLNVANYRQGSDQTIRVLCAVSNLIFTAVFVAGSFIMFEPQTLIGIFCCAAAMVLGFSTNRN